MSTTLLAVDDSVTMRKVLEITFSGEEFRVVTADNPDTALKLAQSEQPDLALVDVTLPRQDGYAFCKMLKELVPGVAVLILSSKQKPYDSVKGSAVGADEFSDKPFDSQQLIDKVKRTLQARKTAPKAAEAAPKVVETPPAKPGAGTLPGATPAPRQTPPNTQKYTPLQVVSGTGTTRPHASAELRSQTAEGLGEAAIQAQTLVKAQQAATQPAIPAQMPPTPKPPVVEVAVNELMNDKLSGLGLSAVQAEAVLALSREVVERIVWEVVPVLAETIIKEELKRLTSE